MCLIHRSLNDFICSNCRMRQTILRPQCPWCGEIFSNYESILVELEHGKQVGEIYSIEVEKDDET